MPTVLDMVLSPFSRAEEDAAAIALGSDHAFVRALTRRRSVAFQLVVTAVPIVLGLAGMLRHVSTAPYVLGAALVVEIGVAAALVFVRAAAREHARELVAAGHGLQLRTVLAERRRLTAPRVREQLARSLERHLRDAESWNEILPPFRPPAGVRCIRFAANEARRVASLLRSDTARAEGAAAVERLLTDGVSSPLFSGDVQALKQELVHISGLLAPTAEPADGSAGERIAA